MGPVVSFQDFLEGPPLGPLWGPGVKMGSWYPSFWLWSGMDEATASFTPQFPLSGNLRFPLLQDQTGNTCLLWL